MYLSRDCGAEECSCTPKRPSSTMSSRKAPKAFHSD